MSKYHRSLDEQAAIRWGELLVSRGDAGALPWGQCLKQGVEEGGLAEMCARFGQPLDAVWTLCEATVYHKGQRVILSENPCPKSWDATRPCVERPGHLGMCVLADVPIATQRANMRQLQEEMGVACAAAALAGGPVPGKRGAR